MAKKKVVKKYKVKRGQPKLNPVQRLARSPLFGKYYAWVAVAILLLTTGFWAYLGAKLQQANADQLVNAYLFEHVRTFRGASLPGQHSFLLKWPLFLLVRLFGYSSAAFIGFSVGLVLVTVGLFAYMLYRIERRPMVFGTICLALASVLLLIPAQPYPGAILPVNMAMLTTRNIEYVFYVTALVLIIRSRRVKSWSLVAATALLTLLIASDKLFLGISLGGALVLLAVYGFARIASPVKVALRWLLCTLGAAAGAVAINWILAATKLTHISGQSGLGPYGLTHNTHSLILGSIYAVLGLLTNVGANPAYIDAVLRQIPHQAYTHLFGFGGLAYIVNMAVLLFAIYLAYHLIDKSFIRTKKKALVLDTSYSLSLMLIAATIAAAGIFIVSNHDYAVDARYLTIGLFAMFVTIAACTRGRKWHPEKILLAGLIIVLGIVFGIFSAVQAYHTDAQALATMNDRNNIVADVLMSHPVDYLVGDYWRVIPTKLAAHNKIAVVPLEGCAQARGTLNSTEWQPDLRNHSFAYLLSLDGSLTNYPQCTLSGIVASYGRPNKSTVIAGTISNPKEILLFFDQGANKISPTVNTAGHEPATVVPIALNQLPNTTCTGPTILNIVAHQDDDLLFMNPDLAHDISAGHCVRSVFVTSGDAGAGSFYWLSRERGSEAAYSYMIGSNEIWIQRIVALSNNEYITVANLRGNSKISLIFMHLPDGGLLGGGFKATHHESLARLYNHKINDIHSVDSQSTYTADELNSAFLSLMRTFQPTEIRTQANYVSHIYPDHSDHMAVGRFVKQAYEHYDNNVFVPIKYYIGYPIHEMPVNVSGDDLDAKSRIFDIYNNYDDSVCQTIEQCALSPTYGSYLKRQYLNAY